MCYTYRTLPSPSEGEEHLTDAELITRSHEGDEDALVALLAKYELLVRKVIRQEIHEAPDAVHLCDDIYQDTVAKVIEHIRNGKPIAHPKAWMVQIAKNLCTDYWRKQRRQTEFEAFASWLGYGVRSTIADSPLQEVLKGEILEFLASQQAIYQDVVNLRIEGYTAPQIAEQLGLAEGTVKSRLNTFRRRLREYYLEEESSDS
ncbi:hypothetical protein C6495_05700 [Candidatus Poribacteria bacterium]|nr:MAG: hypothetical protein C6495_05700 [Candidatus Poribacteria bacterium]